MLETTIIILWTCGFYESIRKQIYRRHEIPEVPDKIYYTMNILLSIIWPVMTIVRAVTDLEAKDNG